MIGDLATKRIIGQGPRRLPRGARVPGAAHERRIERLRGVCSRSRCSSRARVNVLYLTGLVELERGACSSSRAARRRSSPTSATRERAPLRSRASRFERTARLVSATSRTRLAGQTIGFEAHVDDVAALRDAARGRRRAVAATGLVERLRAVKEPASSSDPAGGGDHGRASSSALAEERFVGRTERELAWRIRRSSTSSARRSSRST